MLWCLGADERSGAKLCEKQAVPRHRISAKAQTVSCRGAHGAMSRLQRELWICASRKVSRGEYGDRGNMRSGEA